MTEGAFFYFFHAYLNPEFIMATVIIGLADGLQKNSCRVTVREVDFYAGSG